jgi:hypothetical protein
MVIHEAHHEQFPSGRILNHCRSQTMHFVEIDLHRNLLLLTIPDAPATETKKPAARLRQRAGFPIKTFRLSSVLLRRHAHRVMMMVVTVVVR